MTTPLIDEKPLFIPLKTKFYEDFLSGKKVSELRRYGARWNEKTCRAQREVTLSKGYGKQNRTHAFITKTVVYPARQLVKHHAALMECYGHLDFDVIVIYIQIPKRLV